MGKRRQELLRTYLTADVHRQGRTRAADTPTVTCRMTLHNGVVTYVKDSDKPVNFTLTVPAAALIALAGGDMAAARAKGLTADSDESQLSSLFGVLQPGDPTFNIVFP